MLSHFIALTRTQVKLIARINRQKKIVVFSQLLNISSLCLRLLFSHIRFQVIFLMYFEMDFIIANYAQERERERKKRFFFLFKTITTNDVSPTKMRHKDG